ncbi:MAG: AraC family transcriptional regulator [Coriobacteriales bacterium]|nr:AraC family transcriptional regulator [Coriobacteriales bacterium]
MFDFISNQVYTMPENHLDDCACTELARLGEREMNVDTIKKFCNDTCHFGHLNSYQVVNWFYGISNIVVPVMSKKEHVATLFVGPMLTEDPKKIIKVHNCFKPNTSSKERNTLEKDLSAIQQQDTGFLYTLLQTISTLLDIESLESSYYELSSIRLGESEPGISEYPSTIKTAVDFITENYMDNISLSDVAHAASVHPTYLSRLFHHYTSCSLREYINRLRVTKARKLLLDPSKSILAISYEVGFFDQSYFSRVFKLIEGITPGQYRKINLHGYRMRMYIPDDNILDIHNIIN